MYKTLVAIVAIQVLAVLGGCWQDGTPTVLGEVSFAVVETVPAADADNVSLTSAITVTMSRPLSADSLLNPSTGASTGAVTLKDVNGADVPGNITYNADTQTITLSPAQALAPGRRYTATVRDLRDDRGGSLAVPYSWMFTTLSASDAQEVRVTSTSPESGATGFARNGAILIRFDRELDPSSIVNPTTNTSAGAFILKSASGANVGGTLTYNPSTSTIAFVPTAFLAARVTYTATIMDVRTVDQRALAEPYIWTFTTSDQPNTIPTILSTAPADGATDVSRDGNIWITFSEPVTGVAAGTFVVRDTATNTVLTARSLAFDPVTLTASFRAQSNLRPRTVHTVTVQDLVGLSGVLLPQYTWSFTTGDLPDTTPAVIFRDPAPGATDVMRNSRVRVGFQNPVAAVTTTTFRLRDSVTNALVTAESVVLESADRTAEFVPSAILSANTRYTATLRGVTSADGVTLPETSWEFTTGTSPDNVNPTITAAGLSARANCASEITLTWPPASDDVTSQAAIAYQVFQASLTGGYDLNVPLAVTAPGVTTHRLTGFTPGSTYFFTVRAVDGSGNRSTSFTERSATMPLTFGCASRIAVSGGASALATRDLNGDGRLDLVVAGGSANVVFVLLGNGDGTFTPAAPATIGLAGQPIDLKLADLTNDGFLDLVAASRTGGAIYVLPGNGNGTFGAAIATAVAGARSIVVSEFNNPANGNADLAIATGADVTVLSGNGNGTFSGTIVRLTLTGASDAQAVTAGDFDGDGLTDVGVCYAGTDNAGAWLNSTPGGGALAFTTPTTASNRLVTVQNAPVSVGSPDIDGDGRADLVVLNAGTPSITVRPSSGQSANLFPAGENTALTAGSLPVQIDSDDLDGDGLPDIVTANRLSGTISSLTNIAGTSLFTVESADTGLFTADVVLGDFNGDGRLDAAVANLGDNSVSILLNVR
ncbi:MAG: Ig-like domain-containing protein [Phycisphaerales bacterium]|nr:Ig-like domain-containing protein [Phycisphaerales bacterium]